MTETAGPEQGWDRDVSAQVASTWLSRREAIEAISRPAREWMVAALGAEPGDTVLELAAGAGDTGLDVAEQIGPDGRLISSDFSETMVDGARARGEVRGIANVDYRVLDAQDMDLDDDSVDGVLCRFGYMLMSDQAAALAETRRVLRPGGRAVLLVFGPPDENPFFMVTAMHLVMAGHMTPPEPPPAPGLFSMASPDRTTGLLRDAGFDDVRTEDIPLTFRMPSVDEYLAFLGDSAGPIAVVLRGLSASDRDELRAAVADSVEPFVTDDGLAFPGLALGAVAS